jgi:hypothetical protein
LIPYSDQRRYQLKPRTIKFKQIKAVYETLKVSEEITNYLSQGTSIYFTRSDI